MSSPNIKRKKIQLLPEHLIDQIKAGEVVERPASLIKELLENSLDAGATKIDLHIIDNGMQLIRIDDNGQGMTYDELPFAFGRHATSKIERYDDLFQLHSFGFRGEALASISAVSRVTCSTRPIESELPGGKIVIDGGRIESHTPFESHRWGTSIYIRDLFFNTPVRLKFIKSQTSERNAITKIINAFILSNCHVEFSIKFDDKDKVIYPKVSPDNIQQRVSKIFFRKAANEKIQSIEGEYENYHLKGFYSLSASAGYSGKKQFLFANNRYFQDKSLHQNIMRQLEGLWGPGNSGHYIIMYQVPPHKIDVNIHPNKTQVKFQETPLIQTLTSSTLKRSIEKSSYPQETIRSPLAPSSEMSIALQDEWTTANSNQIATQGAFREAFSQEAPVSLESSNRIFAPLTNRFYIRAGDAQSCHLIDAQKLFLSYWIDNIEKQSSNENILSPLLITEPFSLAHGHIDSHFEKFRDIGFELERIEQNLIVLRTIPNYLNATAYLIFLNELIQKASQQEKLNPSWAIDWLKSFIEENYNLPAMPDRQLNSLYNYFGLDIMTRENIVRELNNTTIQKLFIL